MRGTTIAINGRLYDAHTGLPVTAQAAATQQVAQVPHKNGKVMSDVGGHLAQPGTRSTVAKPVVRLPKAAHSIHSTTQRSTTLHRAALKQPAKNYLAEKPAIKRSPAIQKFAATKSAGEPVHWAAQPQMNSPAQPASAAPQKPVQLKGSALKEKLIADKMAEAMPKTEKQSRITRLKRRYPRFATVVSGIAALVLLGGYLTYLNLPNLSLRVAAGQAGVAATYPSYQPSGYSFAGPVAYSPGEVRVNFKSNTNDFAYSVVERESNWDSQAVRDNYVVKENKQYTTIQEGGITIYLVNNKAVWVNGGVLYSVEGNAPLSGEQIQKIAASTL